MNSGPNVVMNPSTLAANFIFNSSQTLNAANAAMCRLGDLMEFFFVAHPDSGRKEGEESERILYFDSKSDTVDKQVADLMESENFQTQITGFAEAVVNFTGNFVNEAEESDCEFPFRFMPLIDLFRGVDFLPLDSVNYLRAENLIAQMKEKFPQIAETMFLYQERLLSYSVPKSDLPVLFQYLTENLLNMSLRAELQPEQQPGRRDSLPHHHGRFLTGATDVPVETMIASARDVKFPVIFLSRGENHERLTPYQLIVYRALNATVCLFLLHDAEPSFLRELDAMLGPELSTIASRIGDSYVAPLNGLSSETDFHFIYFNPASLSLKTTFYELTGETTKVSSPSSLPVAVYKLACDLVDEFLEDEEFGEVTVKSEPDWWISGKRTNGRLLLLLIRNPAFVSLADVQQHLHSIIKTHFDSIFLT